MNWYFRFAQKTKADRLDGYAWIDSKGTVFECNSVSHKFWVLDNLSLLKKKYNYDISEIEDIDPSDVSDYDQSLEDFLMKKGWIRFTFQGGKYIFTLHNMNEKNLKIIEKILFSQIHPGFAQTIWIESMQDQSLTFLWGDFVESGESFIDFVEHHSKQSY